MSLTTCSACKKEVSRSATRCPHCGHQEFCPICYGDGLCKCNVCNGRGRCADQWTNDEDLVRGGSPCPLCNATGRATCYKCGGSGVMPL